MDPGLLPLTQHIRHQFGRLRILNLIAAGLAATGIVVVGSTATWVSTVSVLLFTGLLASKIWQFMRNDRAIKQFRLEERFLKQPLDTALLKRCLNRAEHIWDDSCTLRGLRVVLVKQLPRLMPQQEKVEAVRRKFHRVYRRLLPTRAQLGIVVPLFLAAHLAADSTLAAHPSIAAGVVLGLVLIEVLSIRTTWQLHDRFRKYEEALSRWALAQTELRNERPHRIKQYRHDLLYRAAPLFSAGVDPASA